MNFTGEYGSPGTSNYYRFIFFSLYHSEELREAIREGYSRSRIISQQISDRQLIRELRVSNTETAKAMVESIAHFLSINKPSPNSIRLFDFYGNSNTRISCKNLLYKFCKDEDDDDDGTSTRISTAQPLKSIIRAFASNPWVLAHQVNHELLDILPIGPVVNGNTLLISQFYSGLELLQRYVIYLEIVADIIEESACCLNHAKRHLKLVGFYLEVDFYLPVFFLSVVSNVTYS